MNTENDQYYIAKYRAGDEEALKWLIDTYTKPIYNFVYRTIQHDTETIDVTQDIFVKMWKHLDKYNPQYSFKTWLFTIAHHTCIDYLRTRKNIPLSYFDTDDGRNPITDTLTDESTDSDIEAMKNEQTTQIKIAIQKLPLIYQSVISLRHTNDFTFEEISRVLNKPVDTIKSQYRRAIHMMRQQLHTHPK